MTNSNKWDYEDLRNAEDKSFMLRFLPYLPDENVTAAIGYPNPNRGYGYGRWEEFFLTEEEARTRMTYLISSGAIEDIELHREESGGGICTRVLHEWRDEPHVPEYWLIKIDERSQWREDIQAQTKDLYGVYFFDRSLRVPGAEPSYELRFIANDYEEVDGLSEGQRDELNSVIVTGNNDYNPHILVSRIERLMKEHPERAIAMDVDPDDKFNPFEKLREKWVTGAVRF